VLTRIKTGLNVFFHILLGGVPERIVFRAHGKADFYDESGDCYVGTQTPPGWTPSSWGVMQSQLKTFKGREHVANALCDVVASPIDLATGNDPIFSKYGLKQLEGHLCRAADIERAAIAIGVKMPAKFNDTVLRIREVISDRIGIEKPVSVWSRLN
jgi:hypothetical protein